MGRFTKDQMPAVRFWAARRIQDQPAGERARRREQGDGRAEHPEGPRPLRSGEHVLDLARVLRGQQRRRGPAALKVQTERPRIPQLRPLQTATVVQTRTNPRRSLTDTDQKPPSRVRCGERPIMPELSHRCRSQLRPHARTDRFVRPGHQPGRDGQADDRTVGARSRSASATRRVSRSRPARYARNSTTWVLTSTDPAGGVRTHDVGRHVGVEPVVLVPADRSGHEKPGIRLAGRSLHPTGRRSSRPDRSRLSKCVMPLDDQFQGVRLACRAR